MISRAFQAAPGPLYRERAPEQNDAYKRFLRRLCCLACGASRNIEAAHTGPRGLGQKADDKRAIPLCPNCHTQGPKSFHRLGRVEFERVHGLDIEKYIGKLNRAWEETLQRRNQ